MPVREDFNDDLLMPSKSELRKGRGSSALRKFRQTFGEFRFVADSAEFRRVFYDIDSIANKQKIDARAVGIVAVIFGWMALVIVAASPVYPADEDSHISLGVASIVLGFAGLGVALFGILVVQKDWLRRRYCTERLRQFFIQNMLFRLPDLVAALKTPSQRPGFAAQTAVYLRALQNDHIKDSANYLKTICEPEQASYAPDWLLPKLDPSIQLDPSIMNTGTLHKDAADFYELYERLRLNPQANYARYKLHGDNEIRVQERWLGIAAIFTIGLAFVMHFLIGWLLAWALSAHGLPETARATLPDLAKARAWADVLIVVIAITGLFFKAVEEGLQPKREAERYEDYEGNCALAKQRFHAAKDGEQKLTAMLDFERVAYEEMKHFLRTNYDARFII